MSLTHRYKKLQYKLQTSVAQASGKFCLIVSQNSISEHRQKTNITWVT